MEAEPDILTEPGTVQEKYDKLLKIKGIGQENAQSFTQNIDRFLAFLRECGLEEKLVAEKVEVEAKVVDVSHPLYGKRIVMSGVRDATIKEKTESVGGIVDDNVGSKTFVLIVKSKGEKETSKMKYAREHQIDIMEPSEFLAKYFA
jgi:NAD-dependent DNA ligase